MLCFCITENHLFTQKCKIKISLEMGNPEGEEPYGFNTPVHEMGEQTCSIWGLKDQSTEREMTDLVCLRRRGEVGSGM